MGQYHKVICPEHGTCIAPHTIDSGLKAREQVWSTTPAAALTLMVVGETGLHPRDLPWTAKGDWAGRAVLAVGDYAENGDLVGREDILGDKEGEMYSASSARARLGQRARRRKAAASVSEALLPVLERVFEMRADDLDRNGNQTRKASSWRTFIHVEPDGAGWKIRIFGETVEDRANEIAYHKHRGHFEDRSWARGPVSMETALARPADFPAAPDSLPDAEAGQGAPLLWVNLDAGEYIDPAEVGDIPDLAGVMKGESARAVLAMLFHWDSRGGGDLPSDGHLAPSARWRADRIVLIGPAGFKPRCGPRLLPGDIRERFRNISGTARAFLEAEDTLGSDEPFEFESGARDAGVPRELLGKVLDIALRAPVCTSALTSRRADFLNSLSVRIATRRVLEGCKDGKAFTYHLAPEFALRHTNGGSYWLPLETRRDIMRILDAEPERRISLRAGDRGTELGAEGLLETTVGNISNHSLLQLLKAA